MSRTASFATRFAFGDNWLRFSRTLDEGVVQQAVQSFHSFLAHDLQGRTFLDIGSGSGLSSLAAIRLGARQVVSFDLDPKSVQCSLNTKQAFSPSANHWSIQKGDVLEEAWMTSLPKFDVVHAWGVLHHTGQMWKAVTHAAGRAKVGGYLWIALYNDQGLITRYWHLVKAMYGSCSVARFAVIALHLPYLVGARYIVRCLRGRPQLERGMSLWYDMKDWLGGYPFEVAKAEDLTDFLRKEGFVLIRSKLAGRRCGNNEFLFQKVTERGPCSEGQS